MGTCFKVSIRAPTKGAISRTERVRVAYSVSIRVPRERCDTARLIGLLHDLGFQSAHPRRVRLLFNFGVIGCELFQSAHPCKVRCVCRVRVSCCPLFQSAHPRRMRFCDLNKVTNHIPFQSAHPQRVRWQHIVKFTQSEHSYTHFAHKIDVILGIYSPLTHPCARSLKEETSRFYDHFGFTLERSFGLSHCHLCCGCKISAAHAQRPFLVYPITQPSDGFDLT